MNQLSHGNNKIFLIFISLNQFTKIIHLIALNETQIYLHFVKHVCMKLWFVSECSNIFRYVEHGVSFLNEYVNFCAYDYRQSEVENIFYGWLFVFQEFYIFFIVLWCYRISGWIWLCNSSDAKMAKRSDSI